MQYNSRSVLMKLAYIAWDLDIDDLEKRLSKLRKLNGRGAEDMTIETIIGIIVGIAGAVFGCVTFFRNKKSDAAAGGKKDGIVLTELGYIKSGVDDIKRKQEKHDEQYVVVVSRLTAVEESTKQAHKRLDRLEDKANVE